MMSEVVQFPHEPGAHGMSAQAASRIEPDATPMEIIRAFQKRAPVNATKLAEAFGLPVFEEAGWPEHVSGLIEKAEHRDGSASGYRIVVRKEDREERKRFTIAHEIAHYLLHRELIGDRLQDSAIYLSKVSGKAEREANQLAADILMPGDLIDEALRGPHELSLERLAVKFGVTEGAMAFRLGIPKD